MPGQLAPLVLKMRTIPRAMEFVGGVPAQAHKDVHYVCIEMMPEELRRRINLAIEGLVTAG